jgi:hypothetical protein
MYQNPKILLNFDTKNNIINESIHAKDAQSPKGALRTVLNGQRDVGFVELNKENAKKIIKHNIGVIPVRLTTRNTIMSIIYRDHIKAHQLYDIAKQKGGYLTDTNPIEARQIGRLLGYTEESIEEYVNEKYSRKPPIRTDTAADYNDLDEENLNLISGELNKKLIKTIKDVKGNDVKIYAVNGTYIKGTNPGFGFIEFVEGGHYYVDSYPGFKKYIPEDEIWIDDAFLDKPIDFYGILNHEWIERNLMKYKKWSYEKAHEFANKAEKTIRRKKLNESIQFSRITDLMERLKILI